MLSFVSRFTILLGDEYKFSGKSIYECDSSSPSLFGRVKVKGSEIESNSKSVDRIAINIIVCKWIQIIKIENNRKT